MDAAEALSASIEDWWTAGQRQVLVNRIMPVIQRLLDETHKASYQQGYNTAQDEQAEKAAALNGKLDAIIAAVEAARV
ncbi:MAG TPA: hypothetical protein VGU45_01585 [Microvirga sp.]|jgi:hypothetical protein|nr:hypothetical protein [Microvirga sp.]